MPLQEEDGAERPVRHGSGRQNAHDVGQTPAGLGEGADVRHGVAETRADEEAEMQQGGRKCRLSQGVEKADHHEGDDVLQVVEVTPGT